MIFGMLPLAMALGEGAEQRAPMGRAVIGGLITSTLLTLFVAPVVYTLLDDFTNRLFRRGSAKPAQRTPVAAPRPEPIAAHERRRRRAIGWMQDEAARLPEGRAALRTNCLRLEGAYSFLLKCHAERRYQPARVTQAGALPSGGGQRSWELGAPV